MRAAKGDYLWKSLWRLVMPKRPPCTGWDPDETITLYVYWKDDYGGRRKIYLRSDAISWLLAYGADELHYQGVALVEAPQSRGKQHIVPKSRT